MATTTMGEEIRELAARLAAAGIPPEAIGGELMVVGAAMLTEAHGSERMARLMDGLAETYRVRGEAMDAERQKAGVH